MTPISTGTKPFGYVEIQAELIDFDATYTFEFEHEGRSFRWLSARPTRVGDLAVFDYLDGMNGTMVVTSSSVMVQNGQ